MSLDEKPVEVEIKKKKRKRLTCKQIGEVFYDKKEGTFLGRLPKDWAFLFIFLVLFYAILGGYFALLFTIFIKGITNPDVPFRTGENSVIGALPGFGFRPLPDAVTNILTVSSNRNSYNYGNYSDNFNKFQSEYLKKNSDFYCNSYKDNINLTKSCQFNSADLGPCTNGSDSLLGGRPCVYLRINNMYGWLPRLVNLTNVTDVLVSCTGNNATDNQNVGQIDYHPNVTYNGINYGVFRNYYFPFLNLASYSSPIVAVQISNITRNQLVRVVCTLVNLLNVVQNSVTIPINMTTV